MTVAVRLANALTPGDAHGKPYLPPGGPALPAAVTDALRAGRADTRDVSAGEAAQFRTVAAEIRAVFDAVAAGRTDAA
ncbi:MAG TPA: CGNR zinc finger domain-containing protein, partial [Streptosporangiaceae bacterium]